MACLLSPAEVARFHADGFVIVRGMFDAVETDLLRRAMEQDPEVASHLLDRLDAQGAATRIALWNRAGDSVYGMAARCERMVDTMATLLGGPVYHFQSKLTAKQPFVGGAWEWHQDYGYWYHNGCVFPHLASCQVALDRSGQDNGCLQMVKGSHLLGRIDHVPVPGEGQNVADPARMV
ncbi:MAG TPA: phytanoyl-CoA dioxygenase family protein, partial [Acetobacteraceae bacterium]|nr:phytanoyl-CoA dioxygenase family protein [Acetobacteraceae bacterium]